MNNISKMDNYKTQKMMHNNSEDDRDEFIMMNNTINIRMMLRMPMIMMTML